MNSNYNTFDYTAMQENFFTEWLDNNCLPDRERLKVKGWEVLPVADSINPMEAEWLSESISSLFGNEVIGLCFEYKALPELNVFDIYRDSILRFNYESSHLYTCITNTAADFLYYKDQANRFFLLCGPQDFIRRSYKCSKETAKMMYLEYWVDSDFNTAEEKYFLNKIWRDYAQY